MLTEAQKNAIQKYDKANTLRIGLKLNLKTDSDIIARLGSVPNKQGYIKKLVRDDIRKEEDEGSIDTPILCDGDCIRSEDN